ncbi:MAG TPA: GAF domain-containing protein [Anaerolineales bacterium]|nr:GAF domain-containing protein [Anaerolineales bacterium]
MPANSTIEYQLKEASQLTNAMWSALVEREAGKWRVMAHYRLGRKNQPALIRFLAKPEVDSWLCGALSGGQSRSVSLARTSGLMAGRLYAFPLRGISRVVIVGADQLSSEHQRLWRLVVQGMQGEKEVDNPSPASSVAASLLIPDLDAENPYDLPRALDRVLASFVRLVSVQGGWLALRRGDSLEVRAQWNAPSCADLSLSMDAHVLLRRMSQNLAPMVVKRGDALWSEIPHKGLKTNTKTWVCIPLVIGQRLIGALALWRTSEFKGEEWNRLMDLAAHIAPTLEAIITFAEMAVHLRRLAMLNDFALTVSSGRNLDQIARRVFALLSRAFGTELILLYLLSSDNRVLYEYRMRDGNLVSTPRGTDDSVIASLLALRQKVRLGEAEVDAPLPLYEGALSGIYVPLRFRGQTIGLLCVESERANAFSLYDENLLVVIASHLASLADYTRLREEAEGRARNLGLIHEVVQQVIGLTDAHAVAEITADLLARYFAYELATVFIADENGKLTIGGFGGTSPNVVRRAMKSVEYPVSGGITGHVFETGVGVLVNDVLQEPRYRPIRGWQAGSEMCVAIREGEKILGIIDVESSSRNAFTHNDFLALESLAGILATVLTSATQYQQLQETINQLRETEMELNARMQAQRHAENRLVQAAKLAAVGEMAAGIAHELNNPLTTVTGFAELVLDAMSKDDPSRSDLELVLREARRARDVVRRLLDFARQSESTRARASLNQVVEDVIALSKHLIHTSGVSLKLNIQEDLPWISMDENQIKQVLLNLVHNALQAMPEGGMMEITTSFEPRMGREGVTVSVRDTGVGIPREEQARIFEPFYTTKGDQGGTGLGLSVTYGIVTDHGGQIEVISEVGEGSTFTVWLPAD